MLSCPINRMYLNGAHHARDNIRKSVCADRTLGNNSKIVAGCLTQLGTKSSVDTDVLPGPLWICCVVARIFGIPAIRAHSVVRIGEDSRATSSCTRSTWNNLPISIGDILQIQERAQCLWWVRVVSIRETQVVSISIIGIVAHDNVTGVHITFTSRAGIATPVNVEGILCREHIGKGGKQDEIYGLLDVYTSGSWSSLRTL